MGTWNALSSIVTVLSGCGVVLLALGCLWPNDDKAPPTRRRRPVVGRSRPGGPTRSMCARPEHPFTVADAHTWMQLHRDHDCPRKRAAFAALVAAGRIRPDSTRRNNLWSVRDDRRQSE